METLVLTFNMLDVRNLKKYFGGVKAVDGCSFKVEKNTITALIGPNGAGKTTAFNLISGLHKQESGTVHLDGQDITSRPTHKRAAAGLSRTFQQVRLFPNLTIAENLALGRHHNDGHYISIFKNDADHRDAITKVLISIGLPDIDIKKRGMELSYGQTKLVGLARALLMPHKLLMLDEPVAGVNPVLRNKLKDILSELKQAGETVLLIEHDMDFVMSVADHIIVMSEGKVLAEGVPEHIKKNKRVLEAYLGSDYQK